MKISETILLFKEDLIDDKDNVIDTIKLLDYNDLFKLSRFSDDVIDQIILYYYNSPDLPRLLEVTSKYTQYSKSNLGEHLEVVSKLSDLTPLGLLQILSNAIHRPYINDSMPLSEYVIEFSLPINPLTELLVLTKRFKKTNLWTKRV